MSNKNFMSYGDAETVLTDFARDIKAKVGREEARVLGAKNLFDILGWARQNGWPIVENNGVFTITPQYVSDLYHHPFQFSDDDTEITLSTNGIELSGATNQRLEILNTAGTVVGTVNNTTKEITCIGCKVRMDYSGTASGSSIIISQPMLRLASDQDDTYVPYAMTNKQLTDDLSNKTNLKLASSGTTASGEIRFGVDGQGNYGYIKAGADTVTPFKTGSANLQEKTTTVTPARNTTSGADGTTQAAEITPDTGYDGMSKVNVSVPQLHQFQTMDVAYVSDAGSSEYEGDTPGTTSEKTLAVAPSKDGMSYYGAIYRVHPSSLMGNATAADVRQGKTFTSGSGIAQTGSMTGGDDLVKTRYTISSSNWSGSANSDGYYTYSLTLNPTLDTSYSPNVYEAGSTDNSVASLTEKIMFGLLEYSELSASNTLIFYAKTKPSSTFYVRVEGKPVS